MDYGLLAPMSVGQVHCSSSGSESCKGRGPNRCWVSTWIHPYTPTHYLLGALFLSCRVLHKYPGFVAPGAAQVPKGASSFAVFVLQGAAQVPCCAAQVPTGASFFAVFVLRKYLQGPHFLQCFTLLFPPAKRKPKRKRQTMEKDGGKTAFRHFSHASTILLVAVEFCLGGKSFFIVRFLDHSQERLIAYIAKKGSLHTWVSLQQQVIFGHNFFWSCNWSAQPWLKESK